MPTPISHAAVGYALGVWTQRGLPVRRVVGLAFFAPFSDQRYRFVWTPLGDPAGRLAYQLLQDALVVLLPAVLAIWLGLRIRRAR